MEDNSNLPIDLMRARKFIVSVETDDAITISLTDINDFQTIETVRFLTGKKVQALTISAAELDRKLNELARLESEEDFSVDDTNSREQDTISLRDLASDAPVVKLVNRLLSEAVDAQASDIHIEIFSRELRVRYRIDGVLHLHQSLSLDLHGAVVSRMKIMAGLDIAERRLPQDGRITVRLPQGEIDLRVSTLPTSHGESVVMRILGRDSVSLDMQALGIPESLRAKMDEAIHRPHGMFLVTGPTGSGKTTTLYTALSSINTEERKIITIEDPVEYQIDGINQIPVNADIGLNFATGLRSIVRQDPDVILVGEIRDKETAEIAIESALTGHLVFSSLHTNDAPGALIRLMDMGVEPYLIAATVNGVLSQRLVRTICPHCKGAVAVTDDVRQMLPDDALRDIDTLYQGKGCDDCSQTGYKGRAGIFEYLPLSAAVSSVLKNNANLTDLNEVALASGMQTLFQAGLEKVKLGETTLSEVLRVANV